MLHLVKLFQNYSKASEFPILSSCSKKYIRKYQMLTPERHQRTIQRLRELLSRKQQMKQTRKNYIMYLLTAAETIENHLRKTHSSVQNMMENISIINMTSDKCDQIRFYGKSMLRICEVYLKHVVQNVAGLKKISEDQKSDQKVQAKYDEFLKTEKQLTRFESEYNKIYKVYGLHNQDFVRKLNKLQEECKNPLCFYNGENPKQDLDTIEAFYNKSQSSQQTLKTDFQLITEKDHQLIQIMKQLEDRFVTLYQKNMLNIIDASKIIIDIDEEQMLMEVDNTQNYDDVGYAEMKKYEQIYSEKKKNSFSNEVVSDFQEFFNNNIGIAARDSQNDLLQERCKNVKDKIIKNITSVNSQRKLLTKELHNQIKFLRQLQHKSQACKMKVLSKNCQQRNTNQKRLFKQCFGQNLAQVEQLALTIYSYKITSFVKIGAYIDNNKEKMQRLISQEQRSMRKFQKEYANIMQQHRQLKQKIRLKGHELTNGQYEIYKNNCIDAFKIFKKMFSQLNRQRKRRDIQFDETLKSLTNHLKTFGSKNQKQLIARERQKFKLFDNIQPINEVINLMKQNPVFDILFKESFLFQFNGKFQSLLSKLSYDQVKRFLQRKSEIFNAVKNRTWRNKVMMSCVPCGPRQKRLESKEGSYICNILKKQKSSMKGQITVQHKYIHFEKQSGFFTGGHSLYIPTNDVRNIVKRVMSQDNQLETLDIHTTRGVIKIKSAYLKQIQQLLKPYQRREDSFQGQQSFNRNSRNSGVMKRSMILNTSQQPKNVGVSYYETPSTVVHSNGMIRKQSKFNGSIIYKDLIKQTLKALENQRYLENYKVISLQRSTNGGWKTNYLSYSTYIKFSIRENKSFTIFDDQKIIGNYSWKITFDNFNLLKSYKHRQKIKIIYNIAKQAPEVQFIETRTAMDHQHYHQKMFYKEVERMNKRLTVVIANIFQKDIQYVQIVQRQSEQHLEPIDQDTDPQDMFGFYKKQSNSRVNNKIRNSIDNFDLQYVESRKILQSDIRSRKQIRQSKILPQQTQTNI